MVSDACSTTSETAHDASLGLLAMFAGIVPARSLDAIDAQRGTWTPSAEELAARMTTH